MKRMKLRGFVLPTLYLLITISIFTGIILLGSDYELTNKEYNYGINILEEKVESVILEDTTTSSTISNPIEEGKAEVGVYFYSRNDEETKQQKSLIYYENTYLPNTGILYTSDEAFDVMAIFAGQVIDIVEDEFFGKCIVIEHDNHLKTYYYGLDEIKITVGDEVANKEVIGISKNNTIMNSKKSFLLEVYHNNELINPEKFIGTKITDYE